MVLGLSQGQKLSLLVAAGIFILFALVSSFLLPRSRPDFPGRGGVRLFVAVTVLLFAGMLTAVSVLGKEKEEPAHEVAAPGTVTSSEGENSGGTTTSSTEPSRTNPGGAARTIQVSETEFKIKLASRPPGPGSYVFDVKNDGKLPHDLVVTGGNVNNAQTPVFNAGGEEQLRVALQPGDYTLYCSVPGHEEAGMKLELKVS